MSDALTLFNFSKKSNLGQWKIINDEVMGGISTGLIQVNESGNGVYSGHVSLKNNGGFSLVQYNMDRIDVKKYSAFILRVKGDGKKYQIRCKSGDQQRHSYIYSFTSKKDWETLTIPFEKMEPFFRGNALKLPNYNGDTLAQVAILIGNNKEEDFSLEIDAIGIK